MYEEHLHNEFFRLRYPTLAHYVEQVVVPLKYENKVFGHVSFDQISKKDKTIPFSIKYLRKLEEAVNRASAVLFKKIMQINLETRNTMRELENLNRKLYFIENPSYTYKHSVNVMHIYYDFIRNLCRKRRLNLDVSDKLSLRIGVQFHDVGKVVIPREILNKPSSLSAEEFEMVRKHPRVGYDLTRDLNLPENAYELILHHHEKNGRFGVPGLFEGT